MNNKKEAVKTTSQNQTFKSGYLLKVKIQNKIYYAEYLGRQRGFECIICNKEHSNQEGNAYTFNIYGYGSDTFETALIRRNDERYETWGFGKEHLKCIEVLDKIKLD